MNTRLGLDWIGLDLAVGSLSTYLLPVSWSLNDQGNIIWLGCILHCPTTDSLPTRKMGSYFNRKFKRWRTTILIEKENLFFFFNYCVRTFTHPSNKID